MALIQRLQIQSAPRTGCISRSADIRAQDTLRLQHPKAQTSPLKSPQKSSPNKFRQHFGISHQSSSNVIEDFPFGPPSIINDNTSENISTKPVLRRCVFKYSDKYTFSRIITPNCLVFDSHFESGNLNSAYAVGVSGETDYSSYDLFLNSDAESSPAYDPELPGSASIQWFCFSVGNFRIGKRYNFNICNFSKPDSLFKQGMRPVLIYISKTGELKYNRCGYDIKYAKHSLESRKSTKKSVASGEQVNYTLSFSHVFEKNQDSVMFAYCFLYTYSDLQYFLSHHIESRNLMSFFFCRKEVLCKTIAGNNCYLLTVTSKCNNEMELLSKPVIFITARVHPGESNSSFLVHGFIEFIVSDSDLAKWLRDHFVFKVIPMLNPDGVINGNNRKSLAGVDLNRVWDNPDPEQHPTIYHVKRLIKRINQVRHVCLCLDLHGHARHQGIFVYGCVPDRSMIQQQNNFPESSTVAGGGGINSKPSSAILSRNSSRAGSYSKLFSTADAQNMLNSSSSRQDRSLGENDPELTRIGSSFVNGVRTAVALANSTEISRDDSWTQLNQNHVSKSGASLCKSKSKDTFDVPQLMNNELPPSNSTRTRIRGGSPLSVMSDIEKNVAFLDWKVRLLPKLLHDYIPSYNSAASFFRMDPSKASTMRMVMFTELGIECSYTIETSMAGFASKHFTPQDLKNFGYDIGKCIVAWSPIASEHIFDLAQDAINEPRKTKTTSTVTSRHVSRLEDETASLAKLRELTLSEISQWKTHTEQRGITFFRRRTELSQILTEEAMHEIRSFGTSIRTKDAVDSEEDASDNENGNIEIIQCQAKVLAPSPITVARPPIVPRKEVTPEIFNFNGIEKPQSKYFGRRKSSVSPTPSIDINGSGAIKNNIDLNTHKVLNIFTNSNPSICPKSSAFMPQPKRNAITAQNQIRKDHNPKLGTDLIKDALGINGIAKASQQGSVSNSTVLLENTKKEIYIKPAAIEIKRVSNSAK